MNMKYFFLLIPLIISFMSQGQNLVRNPGFENKTGCPEGPGEIHLVARWFSANTGTPDYFNDCSSKLDFGTEFNKKGGQAAHSGHGYIGLQSYLMNRNEYFEYIETLLDTALIKDQQYCISFWVSCANNPYAFSQFGAAFAASELKVSNFKKLNIPYTAFQSRSYLDDQEQWVCLHGQYKAKGGERFLVIGHFKPEDDFWSINTGTLTDSTFKSSYYFIDDVSVWKSADSIPCNCIQPARPE